MECAETTTRLYRSGTNELIWEMQLPMYEGCYSTDWAKDSSKIVFVTTEGEIFTWSGDQTNPQGLNGLGGWMARWSPSVDRLLIVSGYKIPEFATVQVVSADGDLLPNLEFQVSAGNGWEPSSARWFDNNIITNSRFGITWRYSAFYSVNSAKLITEWAEDVDSQQNTFPSPDNRWIVVDRHGGTGTITIEINDEYYSLVDLKTEAEQRLTVIPNQLFDFLAWSPDSSTFYTISRPVSETAQASAGVPFGLLALNPQTRTFTQLFEQAVFAQLSPDQTRAWVVFPAKRDDGTLGLDGGVFEMQAGTLTARQYVADEVFYGNPVEGTLLPVAWNHAGTRLVFADAKGGLTLVNVNGETQTLTARLPTSDGWRRDTRLEWSPDDARLLVQSGSRAWVVEVP